MTREAGTPARAAVIGVWLAAAIGALAYAAIFYPGAMSFDSGYLWWQARGNPTSNIHGVGMVWVWRATDQLLPGPAGMFVLQLGLLWSGLALIATSLPVRTAARIGIVLIAATAPVCFVLMSHIWSDAWLMAVLTFVTGALLRARAGHHRAWLLAALGLMFVALTLRHNALPALLPLLIYAAWLWMAMAGRQLRRPAIFGLAMLAALVLQAAALLSDRSVDQRYSVFAVTALWDVSAISLAAGEILLPAQSHGPALTLDDLAQAFEPWSSATLFERTHAGMRQPFYRPDDPLNAAMLAAWLDAVASHPHAYLAHRWQVARALFGTHPREWPHELIYVDGEYAYADNPPVASNATAAHGWCLRMFEAMRDSIALAAWPYLLLALGALAMAWRRRRIVDMRPAFAVLSSGLAYAAPLLVIAPSAELRYLGWSCLTALLGSALVLAAPYFGRMSAGALTGSA